MEYLDFVLMIGAGGEQGYSLKVLESPGGEASGSLDLEISAPHLRHLLDIIARRPHAAAPAESPATAARELGRALFTSLTEARSVYASYHTSLVRAREQGKGLRIRLRCQPPELSALPWELLYDPEVKREHLSLSRETPVVRHLELDLPIEALTLTPPLRILGMVGARDGLDVAHEQRLMARAIEHLTERGMIEMVWVDGHDWRALAAALRRGPWHVFHFIGHGGFDPRVREGFIVLDPESPGERPRRFPAQDLATLLADVTTLKLAVLNSCQGGSASEQDLLSSVGAILASRGIPAVLSMQQTITDPAAIELSRTLYDRLAEGEPVDAAVADARKAIKLALAGTIEWATPVLHLRAEDGVLLRVSFAKALFDGAPVWAPQAPSVRPEASSGAPGSPLPSDAETRRGLDILRRKVRQFWVDGVLARSVLRSARLDLAMEKIEGAVDNPWRSVLETPSGGGEPVPPERSFGQVFEEVGGSLLVLGEPGSGKTVTLLELARDLLAAGEQDPARPVPAVFPLSSWAVQQPPLAAWLVDELAVKYLIPKKIGQAWLRDSRVLPLLDGLDEVRDEARPACVAAVNAFVGEALLTGVVVCCRLKEYLQLPVRLGLQGAIRLLPLREEQVLAYVRAAGEPLAALGRLLEKDSGMMVEARSPLMLSLMAQTYRDLPLEAIVTAGSESLATRRRSLMEAYIARMYRQAGLRGADV